jgi:hypothetical protein
LGDRRGLAFALCQLGIIADCQGDRGRARDALEESITLSRGLGDTNVLSVALQGLGDVEQHQGEERRAARLYQEGLNLAWSIQDRATLALDLISIAGLASAARQMEQAVQLMSAAETLLDTIGLGVSVWPECLTDYERSMAIVRTQLDDTTFTASFEAGHALALDDVIAMARDVCAALEEPEPVPCATQASARAAPPAS